MTDIVFPKYRCRADELCGYDPDALQCFRDAHPNLPGGYLPPYEPYLLSEPSHESLRIYESVRMTTIGQHRRIATLSERFGPHLLPLSEFYRDRLLPIRDTLASEAMAESTVQMSGAIVGVFSDRATSFQTALREYQQALMNVREAELKKLPPAEKANRVARAKEMFNQMNTRFASELRQYHVRARARTLRRMGTSNFKRGVNQARHARSAKPITFTDSRQGIALNRFAQGARVAGHGLLVLDAGMRVRKVAQDYEAGADWERTATIETVGLSVGFLSGLGASWVVTGGLGLLLGATPVGWVIIVTAGITAGYFAGTALDQYGKELAADIYDRKGRFSGL